MNKNITDGVFRNKNRDPFTAIPNHGTPGWRPSGDDLEEVILWEKDEEAEWITVANFQARKSDIKTRNIRFYRANRVLLIKKIVAKRKGSDLLRRPCVYGSTW